MKKQFGFLAVLGLAGIASAQTPVIKAGGIVNVASYAYAGAPNGDIAQGAMVTIFGSNMGPATLVQATSFPLQTSLAGTSLKVTVGSVTTSPLINFTSAGQIAAIIPSDTPVGNATMTVTYNGQTSAPVAFKVVANSFGVFSVNASGAGQGIVATPAGKIFGYTSAANPDEDAVIWGSGLGAVNGSEAGGPVVGDQTNVPVQVLVNSTPATIKYRGRSGCCSGIDQINFVVPNVTGCNVSVMVKINNVVSNTTTMAIAPKGSRTCSDPNGPSAADLQKFSSNGASIGAINLLRLNSSLTVAGFNVTTNVDAGSATFYKYSKDQFNLGANPLNSSTIGACTVTQSKADVTIPAGALTPTSLDAGAAITVTGPGGTKQINRTSFSGITAYSGDFGVSTSGSGFLNPGNFTVTGPGGANVGAFTTSITIPAVLTTNVNNISSVTRAAGLTVTWSGGDPNGVVVIGGSSTNSSASDAITSVFVCQAAASAGTFTVPAAVTLQLVPSGSASGSPLGTLFVGSTTNPKTFTATGLDLGVVLSTVEALKTLGYN